MDLVIHVHLAIRSDPDHECQDKSRINHLLSRKSKDDGRTGPSFYEYTLIKYLIMITPNSVRRILASWPVGVLSTWGEASIHSVPVVFVPVDDILFSPIDGKPKAGSRLQRIVDLERDPRFTLLLQHYADDWKELWWLRLTGVGTVDTLRESPLRGRVLESLQDKYSQYISTDVLTDSEQVLRLQIEKTAAWAYQGLDWLEAQFP